MFGQFVLNQNLLQIASSFECLLPRFVWREQTNISPSNYTPIVRSPSDGLGQSGLFQRELVKARWGLVPPKFESAREADRYEMHFVRAERLRFLNGAGPSVARGRLCVVPARGFLTSRLIAGREVPFFVTLNSDELLGFAGVWANWEKRGERILSFGILSLESSGSLEQFGERMPLILEASRWNDWLGFHGSWSSLEGLLKPFDDRLLDCVMLSSNPLDSQRLVPAFVQESLLTSSTLNVK